MENNRTLYHLPIKLAYWLAKQEIYSYMERVELWVWRYGVAQTKLMCLLEVDLTNMTYNLSPEALN